MTLVTALSLCCLAASSHEAPCPNVWQLGAWAPPRFAWHGSYVSVPVAVVNTSRVEWSEASSDHLSYHWRKPDGTVVVWDGDRTTLGTPVPPGQRREVQLRVRVPKQPGEYQLELAMVREQVCWFSPPTGQVRFATVRVLPRLPFLVLAMGVWTGVLTVLALRARAWRPWVVPALAVAWLVMCAAVAAKVVAFAADLGAETAPAGVLWAGAWLLALPLVFLPARRWAVLAGSVGLAVVALSFGDTLYLRFFGSVLPLSAWRGAGQLGQVWDSVRSLMRPEDWWLAVLAVWAVVLFFWPRWEETWARRWRVVRNLALALAIAGASWPLVRTLRQMLARPIGTQVFSYQIQARELGLWGVHLFDAVRKLQEALGPGLGEEERQQVKAFFAARAQAAPQSGPGFGALRGSNLVLIQVESLQNFVVGLSVAGQEVTPFLNSLRRRGLYFSWVFDQTNQGRSSDGEFIALNSQHALAEGAVVFRRAGNRFFALPKILRGQGYRTLSAHAFDRGFWNRAVLHPKYGFERSLFKEELGSGEVIGWGLADGVFLERVLPQLGRLQEPFFAFLITLGLHHPFDAFPEGRKTLKLPDFGDPALSNYLQSMRYVDAALERFFQGVAAAGLAQRTVVALYGDHEAGFPLQAPLASLLHIGWSPQQLVALRRVPLFIVTPDPTLSGEVDEVGGQVDIAPTLLHLLGVPRPGWFVGRALIPKRGAFAALPDGSGADEHHIWVAAPRVCADRRSLQPRDAGLCQALQEAVAAELTASRAVVEHDLLPLLAAP